MPEYSERFDEALAFARETHRDHLRKGSEVPYIGHLLGVASIVIDDGGSEDEAIAALLHDAAEDQGGAETLDEIERRFGRHVRDIVDELSDTLEEPKPEWRERKERYLAHLEQAMPETKRVSLADKLYNARSIVRDGGRVGPKVWDRFSTGRDGSLWYYGGLARFFKREFEGTSTEALADELEETVVALAI
jgi:(p)ppGpp synthase/HD superfamily hydrolase